MYFKACQGAGREMKKPSSSSEDGSHAGNERADQSFSVLLNASSSRSACSLAYPYLSWSLPASWSRLPAIMVRSSSVSLPHFSLTLPWNCFQLPFTWSQFIGVAPFQSEVKRPPATCPLKAEVATTHPKRAISIPKSAIPNRSFHTDNVVSHLHISSPQVFPEFVPLALLALRGASSAKAD